MIICFGFVLLFYHWDPGKSSRSVFLSGSGSGKANIRSYCIQFFLIQSIFKGLPPVEPGGFIDGESDLDPVTGLPVPRPKPQVYTSGT